MNFPSMTRRDFLKRLMTASGLTIAVTLVPHGYELWSLPAGRKRPLHLFTPSVWLQITSDELITVMVSKSEMGQGITTTLPMIVADELDADWSRIRFALAPAGERYHDPGFGAQMTFGSTSVRHMIGPLRKAGAAAREMLIEAAARMWKVPAAKCETLKGVVRYSREGRSLTYGQLCEQAAAIPVPSNPQLKDPSRFKIIGTSVPRLDMAEKTEGTTVFGYDVFVQDMLYASVAHPPTFGSRFISYDKEATMKVPGVQQVVSVNRGIAVCGDSIQAVWSGREALGIRWTKIPQFHVSGKDLERDLLRQLKQPGVAARREGNSKESLERASRKIKAVFLLPYLAHAPMEPMNCTAHVRKDGCDIWVPTQTQTRTVQTVARETGLNPEQIRVYTTYSGGSFGRRLETDFVQEAVQISRAVNRPIKLVWTREEDMQNDFYRPASCCSIEGGLDENGRLLVWKHKVVAPSLGERLPYGRTEQGADLMALEGLIDTPYAIPNLHVEYVKVNTPVPVGFWRSGGNSHNAFAVESFMDELAHAAHTDPLEFRLSLLAHQPRALRVLQVVAEKSGWGKPPASGRGRGIALHAAYGSYVAQVAEVSVDEHRGAVAVHKVFCAVDCGLVIHPDTVAAQMEGGIIFGLSAALKEKVEVLNGGVVSENFTNYPILRLSEAPEIEVEILRTAESPGGIGEAGVSPIAPAVANAVFSATGARLRQLPMSHRTVVRALKKAGRAKVRNIRQEPVFEAPINLGG